jgi:hypothetical protein
MVDLIERLIEESAAETPSCICQQCIDRTTRFYDSIVEFPDTCRSCEIGLNRKNIYIMNRKLASRIVDCRLISGNNKVKAMICAAGRKFVADSGRCAGDDSELVGVFHEIAPAL